MFRIFFKKHFIIKSLQITLLLVLTISGFAQKPDALKPSQDKLLNGLKVLTWKTTDSNLVTIKIRIHSGASFDPQEKEGVMALLSDNLFPNPSAREFFVEDLGGNLEVTANYDYIQINASGKSEEFLQMLQTLANAVSNMTIDKATTAKLKTARLEKISQLENDLAYIADRAAAKRLLGTFPYGRPLEGVTESVKKIDFADLIFARDRFLTADNSTIAVIGNVKSDFAMRAIKRYFGGWQKSENRVPSTFRQPDDPDTKPFSVAVIGKENTSEIRYAMRGLARNDKDFAASEVFTKILQYRLQNSVPKDYASNAFARHEEHILPGLLILGFTTKKPAGTDSKTNGNDFSVSQILSQTVTNEEFNNAKTAVLNENKTKEQADQWFDVDTFRLSSVADEASAFDSLSLNDVQRVAERLAKNPHITVVLTQKPAETTTN